MNNLTLPILEISKEKRKNRRKNNNEQNKFRSLVFLSVPPSW